MTSSPSWRDTPVEFVGVPAGAATPDSLISLVVGPHVCPDCLPTGYSLRYSPAQPGMAHTDPRAWTVIVTHADSCPRLWLLRQRADGAM